jgi:hypothetical protein
LTLFSQITELLPMPSALQDRILRALFVALRPLVRSLLNAGIGYREFSSVAKAAFIEEASEGYGLRGRATNISRVAVMTGITRKEVGKIKDSGIEGLITESIAESPASVVLSRWHAESDFCDANNFPKVLEFDSGEVSFSSLVKKFAGDIPPGAVRTELKRIGAIEELPGRRLKLLKRHFVPAGLDDRLVIGLQDVAAAEISTLAFNCDPTRIEDARYHRVTSLDNIPRAKMPLIREEARRRLGALSDSFDEYLVDQANEPSGDAELVSNQIGIGLFYFER